MGTGHYTDGFCWFLCVCILSPYLGPYQRLARPDILSGSLSGTDSLIPRHDSVIEIGTNVFFYMCLITNMIVVVYTKSYICLNVLSGILNKFIHYKNILGVDFPETGG